MDGVPERCDYECVLVALYCTYVGLIVDGLPFRFTPNSAVSNHVYNTPVAWFPSRLGFPQRAGVNTPWPGGLRAGLCFTAAVHTGPFLVYGLCLLFIFLPFSVLRSLGGSKIMVYAGTVAVTGISRSQPVSWLPSEDQRKTGYLQG